MCRAQNFDRKSVVFISIFVNDLRRTMVGMTPLWPFEGLAQPHHGQPQEHCICG
jgi:hypothetical protein